MEEFKQIQLKNVTSILVIFHIFIYILQLLIPGNFIEWNFSLFSLDSSYFKPWQFLTYSFLHGNFFHIFFNMLVLLIFGTIIEVYTDKRSLLEIFFLSTILTGVSYSLLFDKFQLIGASAGTYGLIIAFTYFWPRKYLFVFGFIPIESRFLVIGLLLFGFISGIQSSNTSQIAHFAHIIGSTISFCYLEIKYKKYIQF